jgi:hypothetical protein
MRARYINYQCPVYTGDNMSTYAKSIEQLPDYADNTSTKERGAPKLLVNKAFFGKGNCLKFTLNAVGDVYMHFGVDKDGWQWKKVKFSDMELGQIALVLEGKQQAASFFHDFQGKKTQIWVNRQKEFVFIKVKELSKSLSIGEQYVLKTLIDKSIWHMNMSPLF